MSDIQSETAVPAGHLAEVQKYLRRNYTLNVLEGAIMSGGMAFIDPNVVAPRIVENLGGPTWLIAFMPLSGMLGAMLPQVLVARRIEALTEMKPYVLALGLMQRLMFLSAGLFLLFFAQHWPVGALAAVALAPFMAGVFGGLHGTAWQELVAKTVPSSKLSSMWAVRFLVGSLIGIGVGRMLSALLEIRMGVAGYGVLYLAMFVLSLVSLALIAGIHETHLPPKRRVDSGLHDFIKSIGPVIRSDRTLAYYLVVRVFSAGMFIIAPFVGITALRVLHLPDSSLGTFVSVQMAGAIAGYVLGGWLGDSRGAKPVVVVNQVLSILLVLWIGFAHTRAEFLVFFFLFGAAGAFGLVGTLSLGMHLCPVHLRISYLTIIGLAGVPGLLLAWGLGTWGRAMTQQMSLLAIPAAAMLCVSLVFLLMIRAPSGATEHLAQEQPRE